MTKKKDIEFLRVTHLRGPNIWTYRPVIEAWLDIGELENFPSNKIPGLYERLTALLPGMVEHRCGVGEHGGFFERLRDGIEGWEKIRILREATARSNKPGSAAALDSALAPFTWDRGKTSGVHAGDVSKANQAIESATRALFPAAD